MPEITDIAPQIKDKKRCSIYLDGKFYCGLLLETALKHRIKVGQHIETEKIDEIQLDNEKNQAMDKALNYLSRSMKTKKQITDYLKKKGYTETVCDYIIEKLTGYNYVNDYDYCKCYISDKNKYKGKRLLELELKRKGADAEDIKKAVSEISDESESAYNVFIKYIKNKEKTKENFYKAFKYLLSKGFDYETAGAAIEKYKEEGE